MSDHRNFRGYFHFTTFLFYRITKAGRAGFFFFYSTGVNPEKWYYTIWIPII